MYIEPNTTIHILSECPLDNTYDHTVYFESLSAQFDFFYGLKKYTLNQYTYQRVNSNRMRVQYKADDLYDCNYIMFQNTNYGNKWFYAFIKGVEYVNNVTSEIEYELDVMQTWFFDWRIKPSFVERECVMDDTPFKYFAPENFTPSEYICEPNNIWLGHLSSLGLTPYITVAFTKIGDSEVYNPKVYSGMYSGLSFYSVPVSQYQDITDFINAFDFTGVGSAIVAIFMSPYPVTEDGFYSDINTNINIKNRTMSGYTIKNNKLLQYPFCRLKLKSTDGNDVELKPELVNGDTLSVRLWFSTSMTPTITLTPSYSNVASNWDYAIQYSENPQCAWSNDVFANWQAQNLVSQSIAKLSAVANVGGNVITAASGAGVNPGGLISNTINALNPWATEYQMSVLPGKAGGVPNGGSVNYAFNRIGFEGWYYTMNPYEAKIFDDYLSMFGYAVNTIKVPNLNGRPHWNYVKTRNIALTGSMPVDDMTTIKAIFDKGITFWKNGYELGDYSLDNSIQ